MPFDTQVSCMQGPISPSGPLGGGGVFPRLLSFVCRAMAIAPQLTNLHISIPASGAPPGGGGGGCRRSAFCLRVTPLRGLTDPRRVSFASGVTILGSEPALEQSPVIQIHDPVCPDITVKDEMDSTKAEPDVPIPDLRPPPGFRQFSCPREEWGPDGDRLCLTFQRNSPAGFLGDIRDSRLIRRRCRFRQSLGIAWMTR